jgi:hypothetical protein
LFGGSLRRKILPLVVSLSDGKNIKGRKNQPEDPRAGDERPREGGARENGMNK